MRNTFRGVAGQIRKCLTVASAAVLLHGCVTLQPVTSRAEMPKADVGYVAGVFVPSSEEFGLGITNINGGEETVLPFTDPAQLSGNHSERVTMIQLPPGRYRISSWLTFNSFYKDSGVHKKLPQSEEFEFTVAPGRVKYLGRFLSAQSVYGFTHNFKITPTAISVQDLKFLTEMYYPNFGFELYDPQPGSVL